MKPKQLFALLLLGSSTTMALAQSPVVHYDMSLTNGQITEENSGNAYQVSSQLPACTLPGIDGNALRFDGYSNFVKAALPATLSTEKLTVNVVLAAETYPMMQMDAAETTPTYATICGNLADDGKKGFALQLSSQGDLKAVVGLNYGGGYKREIAGSQKLQRGQWNVLTLVYDKTANAATLYLNGSSIGTTRVNNCDLLAGTADFYIGKDATEKKEGPFLLNTFCGLIDDIAIFNDAVAVDGSTQLTTPRPSFNYPASRYDANPWRPQYHAMPAGSWTNETHGMTFSDGKYHVFFQKNANGPYMSRLHWGHLSSANLYQWTEEPIAIYPGEPYDIKGCWSGCVYEDGGDTYILYTGVDNAKARIIQAKAKDATLLDWADKKVAIDGKPSNITEDDFRDPYYFEANGNKYIIVGTKKNGVGACTLHQLKNGSWTNDGTLFFQGTTASQHGTFWEMPNVTKIGDKWLFTCTPQGTSAGVRTLCWVGTIGQDGKFTAEGNVQYLEMQGISRDGYGLLSPSIYQKDGKTLLLGIVPDKLPGTENHKMGWAHNYSLPRELSLDAQGQIVQRPYSALTDMRTETTVSVDESLQGSKPLVSGRQIELLGEFTPTSGTCGFRFLKNASLTYDAATRQLTLDLTQLSRTTNDASSYNGIYQAILPETLNKLHVYLDGSILDIFVNERWAYSVRVFPNGADDVQAEVFATAATAVKVQSWTLDAQQTTALNEVLRTRNEEAAAAPRYNMQGLRVGSDYKGLVICNGRKYVAR